MADLVYIDDTDPRIEYSGSWALYPYRTDGADWGNFGPSWNTSLHVTTSSGSLSYAFRGTSVFFGITNKVTNISGIVDPTVQCFVDGTLIKNIPYYPYTVNKWTICFENLVDRPHIFTAKTTTVEQPFLIDYISYHPSSDVPLDNETVLFYPANPIFHYNPTIAWSTTNRATVSLDFQGIKLSWFGTISPDTPGGFSRCTYTIDGGDPVPFTLNALPPGNSQFPGQLFFQTPKLSPGHHNISVMYLGAADTVPLSVDYILIQNSSVLSSPTSLATSTSSPSPSSVVEPSAKSSPNLGAIIGGVMGGLGIIILLLSALLLLCHRARKRAAMVDRAAPFPFTQRGIGELVEVHAPVAFLKQIPPRKGVPSTPEPEITRTTDQTWSGTRSQPAPQILVDPSRQVANESHSEDSGIRLPQALDAMTPAGLPPVYTHL